MTPIAHQGVSRLDIHSRFSATRPEDKRAKEYLQRNWGTIEKLADTISGGKYSQDKARKAAPPPQAQGLIIIDQAPPRRADEAVPYLRISLNGRVVIADTNTGVQLAFLGQIKRLNGEKCFFIATAENGFITPLDPEIADKIADLEQRSLNRAYTEDQLADDIKARLEIA
ncbi:MAG: hypothetical protein A3D16_00480 [Rhodobacterales bacterium RIFCSPHIGHO2_02_FULL_62_130]|nr:MAG: hypothetical protein A3D16_00480 [Rhodobacterales bacterium RIFCSPHIGHO2_02_FULL_62_130]OHC55202.1 MAG: hypothetical protein A3E48_10125 [Rhodobacterales bacterium RIFCSPHIGHO2_12_FULL_62_75]